MALIPIFGPLFPFFGYFFPIFWGRPKPAGLYQANRIAFSVQEGPLGGCGLDDKDLCKDKGSEKQGLRKSGIHKPLNGPF